MRVMCRNIRILHNFDPPTTKDEVDAAALQFVRKVSGMQKPSKANEAAFERAIAEVAATTSRLLGGAPQGPRGRALRQRRLS
jgi:hypothetical protein